MFNTLLGSSFFGNAPPLEGCKLHTSYARSKSFQGMSALNRFRLIDVAFSSQTNSVRGQYLFVETQIDRNMFVCCHLHV